MRQSVTNPQQRAINQKRGPTTGNANPGAKRGEFLSAKSKSSSERSALADMVSNALSRRGDGMKPHIEPAVEPLSGNTNVGRRKK